MISVYTVNKNTDIKWIKQCVEALSGQTFRKFEYIFLDYGSDNVEDLHYMLIDMLGDIDFKFIQIDKDKDFSFIDAIRVAIDHCGFESVLRADADDIMRPECLKRLIMNSLENHIVYSDYYVINEDNKPIGVNTHNRFLPAHALIRKSIYDLVRYLPGQQFRDGTSLEIAIRNNDEINVKHVKERLFFYRQHTNSLTSNKELVEKTDKEINA